MHQTWVFEGGVIVELDFLFEIFSPIVTLVTGVFQARQLPYP